MNEQKENLTREQILTVKDCFITCRNKRKLHIAKKIIDYNENSDSDSCSGGSDLDDYTSTDDEEDNTNRVDTIITNEPLQDELEISLFSKLKLKDIKWIELIKREKDHQYKIFYTTCMFAENADTIEKIIDRYDIAVNRCNSYGTSGFMLACAHNTNLDVIVYIASKLTIENIIAINKNDHDAFSMACKYNSNPAILKYLAGNLSMNIHRGYISGYNNKHYGFEIAAIFNPELSVIKCLSEELYLDTQQSIKNAEDDYLVHAINNNPNQEIIKYLIEDIGASIINVEDCCSYRPEEQSNIFVDYDYILDNNHRNYVYRNLRSENNKIRKNNIEKYIVPNYGIFLASGYYFLDHEILTTQQKKIMLISISWRQKKSIKMRLESKKELYDLLTVIEKLTPIEKIKILYDYIVEQKLKVNVLDNNMVALLTCKQILCLKNQGINLNTEILDTVPYPLAPIPNACTVCPNFNFTIEINKIKYSIDKELLASQCPVLSFIADSDFKDLLDDKTDLELQIDGVDPDVVDIYLKLLYCGKPNEYITTMETNKFLQLCKIVDRYPTRIIIEKLEYYMCKTYNTCFKNDYLIYVERYNLQHLFKMLHA